MEFTSIFIKVLLGASLLGVVAGVMGCFALLRRQSLLGDAVSHAALPGVCIAFLITGGKDPLSILIGALLAGFAGSLFILLVVRGSRIKEDSAIGIVLSVFFGVGIVLLTYIKRLPVGNRSGLDTFLFGQAATLMWKDVLLFTVVALLVLTVIIVFYKEFKLLCFDRSFGDSLGLPMRRLEIVLTSLLVVVVVIGLQTVGVILMLAALVTPAAAARQWTDRFLAMLVLAGSFGAISSGLGVLASSSIERMPTGPAIVMVSSAVLIVSLLLAPGRGLVWNFVQSRRLEKRIRHENLLTDLYRLGERQKNWERTVSAPTLMGMRGQSGREIWRTVGQLESRGLLAVNGDAMLLTTTGLDEASDVVRKHRLWELYLMRRLDLPADHVHRDAEAMEHALTDEAVAEFEELLGYPQHDPHGREIPKRRRSS